MSARGANSLFRASCQNVGDEDLRFLELFRSNRFEDLSFSEWLAHTPPELVTSHLDIDKATHYKIPREKLAVLPP
jgi:oxalate decarboxylase